MVAAQPVARARRFAAATADRLPARVGDLVRRLAARELLLDASSLAFYGLVSVLPLLTITFSIAGALLGDGTLERFARQAEESGPAGTGQLLQQLLETSDSLSWAAVVFTVWPATAYGGGLRRALERATEAGGMAPALRGRLTAVGMLFALPVLVLAGLPLAAVLTALGDDGAAGTIVGWTLAVIAVAGTLTLVLAVLYHAFAPAALGWPQTLRGAALTGVVTTVFSIGFVAYLRLGNVEERFGGGTVGLVVLLGVYLFVANALLLVGFEVVAELEDGAAEDHATARAAQRHDGSSAGNVT